jgi:ABC-type dipeptide/oligopeptide/nickel transport system permease subunit
LPRTAGPRSAAPALPLIILSALRAALSGLRFAIQILELTGLARTYRSLTLALRK